MSKKKFTYRSPVVWNVILFVIFSYLFLFLQDAYHESIPEINHFELLSFIKLNKFQAALFLLTCVGVYRLSRFIPILYGAATLYTVTFTVHGLWLEFSKLIIVLLFFYILFSYYLYQFLKQDIKESYYNPLFEDKFLFKPMCFKIPVLLVSENNEKAEGHLTNWSEGGFFMYLENPKPLKGKHQVTVNFDGHEFHAFAKVVTKLKDQNGFGFKILPEKEEQNLNWNKFLNIVYEMGYQPELLV